MNVSKPAYSDPSRESDPHALPDLEVFFMAASEQTPDTVFWLEDCDEPRGEGWYYWFCFPGCMPDSDPEGPFDSEAEALADARDF